MHSDEIAMNVKCAWLDIVKMPLVVLARSLARGSSCFARLSHLLISWKQPDTFAKLH